MFDNTTLEQTVTELGEEYLDCSVSFDGNDEIEAFYGRVDGFCAEADGTIFVTLVDMDDDAFDIDWNEVKHEEFD